MVTHLAPIHVVATALHTVTGQHMAATAEPRAANALHTATAMAQAVATVLQTETAQPMATAMAALLVATVLLTATGQHMAATVEPRAANALHTATAVAQLAAPHLAK